MRRYIAFIDKGPCWVEGKSLFQQGAPVEGHLMAMRAKFDAGEVLMGGPFDQGGGIAVLDVPDEAAARELMEADPAVRDGVMVYEIRSLRPIFDKIAGIRTEGTASQLGRRAGRNQRRPGSEHTSPK